MPDELDILKKLLPTLPQAGSVAVGPGDDCAALEWSGDTLLLAAADQLIGGVHYYREATTPRRAGRKLMCRNLSDIAAMGGRPLWALLTVAASGRTPEWILEFCRGVSECGAEYGVSVVGGDIASLPAPGEVTTLTILGTVRRGEIVRRSGAKPGDLLYVTGALGNSLAGGHHLDFEPRLAEGRFLAEGKYASAMLDVSDGLLLGVIITFLCIPSATNATNIAYLYGGNHELASSGVMLSTLLSMFTLPALMQLLFG